MTVAELVKEITKREGKKVQVNVAQVSEVLKVVKEIVYEKTGFDIYSAIKTFNGPFQYYSKKK